MVWLRQLRQDAGVSLRMLRRVPGFTVAVILTLAVGIGMTSAVFSVFNAALLRPLAYSNPDCLLWLTMSDPRSWRACCTTSGLRIFKPSRSRPRA